MTSTYAAFLQGVNVGARRMKMADVRALFEALGFQDVRTYLQSGNVVFSSTGGDRDALASRIEPALEARFGFPVETVVLAAPRVRDIVARNPFTQADAPNVSWLLVQFARDPIDAAAMKRFMRRYDGPEVVRVARGVAYAYFAKGIARSKLAAALKRAKLPLEGTARNMKVATAVAEMANACPGAERC